MNSNLVAPYLQCGDKVLDLGCPVVMGVLNVTPDSFSDGGSFVDKNEAIARAVQIEEEGAEIIDVGGESTRPGAVGVSVQEELDRVIPIIEALSSQSRCILSIDTSSPEVIQAAAIAGAGIINDVRALRRDGALEAAQATGLPVCLMHMQGQPDTMQNEPAYQDVVSEVIGFFHERIGVLLQAGIAKERIIVDPGFGFGKTLPHNLLLLRQLSKLNVFGLPILAGVSRKSMVGQVTGRPVDQRMAGSLAAAVMAVERGARILRVHDVAETVDAVKMRQAVVCS